MFAGTVTKIIVFCAYIQTSWLLSAAKRLRTSRMAAPQIAGGLWKAYFANSEEKRLQLVQTHQTSYYKLPVKKIDAGLIEVMVGVKLLKETGRLLNKKTVFEMDDFVKLGKRVLILCKSRNDALIHQFTRFRDVM